MAKAQNLRETAIDDERDSSGTPVVPKTSGAAPPAADTSKSTAGNRDPGPRKAGATPRPTDKPITGGDRG